ncbi:MAG: glycosyltransferase family 4 protein [Nitriliruptoraceae bacterium]
MRILMLSWEYPPRIIGGLGRHVAALSQQLACAGHRVHVVSRDHPSASVRGTFAGVDVLRVSDAPPNIAFDDLLPWVLAFNNGIQATATPLLREYPFDVIHAHDWLVAYAAIALSDAWHLPLVSTIHATEHGRHQGHLPNALSHRIHETEAWLVARSDRIVTCSAHMRAEVARLFAPPADRLTRISNGVAIDDFTVAAADAAAYRQQRVDVGTQLVVFAGRLEFEKGVHTLLHALQQVQHAAGPTRLVVAGVGSYSPQLRRQVDELGLQADVEFAGFVEDHELKLLYAAADVVVAPSIYEPFGLVAVEAMASGTPVVVGDTGGLREIVADGSGLMFLPGDADELAAVLIRVLTDRQLAQMLVDQGRTTVTERFNWGRVAVKTAAQYALVQRDRPQRPVAVPGDQHA